MIKVMLTVIWASVGASVVAFNDEGSIPVEASAVAFDDESSIQRKGPPINISKSIQPPIAPTNFKWYFWQLVTNVAFSCEGFWEDDSMVKRGTAS